MNTIFSILEILSETIKSIPSIVMTISFLIVFIISPLGKKFIKSFMNTFLDKEIPTTTAHDESYKKEITELIKTSINNKLKELTEDEQKSLNEAKSKINEALKSELESLLENNVNLNIKELVASKIEQEASIISDDILNNSETFDKINNKYNLRSKEKNNFELNHHIRDEYLSARRTKQLMSNLFIMINFFYFIVLLYLAAISFSGYGVRLADNVVTSRVILSVSFAYIGFGSFVIYMIKFCNARTLTLLSLKEEISKREDVFEITKLLIKSDFNENHVALMKILNTNYSFREQATKHPYELLFNGVKDSNIVLKAGKFELSKDKDRK